MPHDEYSSSILYLPCKVARWDNSAEPGGHYHREVEIEFDVVIEHYDGHFWIDDTALVQGAMIVKSPLNDAPIVMTEDMAEALFHPAMTS